MRIISDSSQITMVIVSDSSQTTMSKVIDNLQAINGVVMAATLVPVLLFLLPTTHSIPRLASARLRPQDYWPMIKRNPGLREGNGIELVIKNYELVQLTIINYDDNYG